MLRLAAISLLNTALAFYGSNDKVVNLDPSNFKELVLESSELWLVEFYAPWCGHCRNLTPAWKAAAKELDGVVNIGAVDADKHKSLGQQYGIRGFPTLKVFGANKQKPKDYNGGRESQQIVDAAFSELRQMMKDRKNGDGGSSGGSKKSSGGGNKKKHTGGDKDVLILTDDNFQAEVLDSLEPVIVEFYAPWCGHCKQLEPHWNEAASAVKEQTGGKVKIAKLDATAHTRVAGDYQIQGYPTIKIFHSGDKHNPVDYNSGRTAQDIITEAMNLFETVRDPPELRQLVDPEMFTDKCSGAQLCIIFAIPHIFDDQSAARNERLEMMRELTEKFKTKTWEWFWTEAGEQQELEKLLDVGGSGYPALAALNVRRKVRATMTGQFSKKGISEFLNHLAVGRQGRNTAAFTELPSIKVIDEWDGKDAVMEVEDDIDLDDFDWGDDEEEDNEVKDEL